MAVALTGLASLGSAHNCQQFQVSIPLNVPKNRFWLVHPQSDIDVTNFMLDLTRRGHNYGAELIRPVPERDGDASKVEIEVFSFDATFCRPDDGPGKFIQILTAGYEWDRTYWDPPHDNYSYSYVAVANDEHNFATLTWDGVDQDPASLKDGFLVQSDLEIEALHMLTTMVRNGTINEVGKYDKVVHGGHSAGAQYIYDLVSKYPDDSDAIILTGFLKTNNSMAALPHSLDPSAFRRDDHPGWIRHNSLRAIQAMYFSPSYLDHEMIEVIDRIIRPIPMGKLLTLGSSFPEHDNLFEGPVFNIVGQRDVLFCEGDCFDNGRVTEEQIKVEMNQFLSRSKDFQLYIVPEGGHALNFERHRQYTFSRIFEFLANQGNLNATTA
ncbi:uncharacterized protein B0I36DRAFT_361949 [Microdochium trichocladiopsis]|uniref:Alpha/Beta hydrolase protein n=1 Tax=Microdochium trichocladiopsis TaxID=1682393 RepID=A0A9P8Y9V4_9PEZI|nr:uncharacterized protein B0I36DRAFT_361949 [Microdochium trichocladiopsis]KAH7033256.1 hypothetical protein B0I36DRAFT_361949 [Microdochium trichocladiopsis]